MPMLFVGRCGRHHLLPRRDHRLRHDRPRGHLAQPEPVVRLLHVIVEERLDVARLLGKLQHLASRLQQDVRERRLRDLRQRSLGSRRVRRRDRRPQRWHHRVPDRCAAQRRPEKARSISIYISKGLVMEEISQGFGLTFYLVVIVGSVVMVDSTTFFSMDEE